LREFLRLGTTEPVPDHSWLMWTATESEADFVLTPAPCGASQANRRFAPGVGGPLFARPSAETKAESVQAILPGFETGSSTVKNAGSRC
jgi:hypothetical protein